MLLTLVMVIYCRNTPPEAPHQKWYVLFYFCHVSLLIYITYNVHLLGQERQHATNILDTMNKTYSYTVSKSGGNPSLLQGPKTGMKLAEKPPPSILIIVSSDSINFQC